MLNSEANYTFLERDELNKVKTNKSEASMHSTPYLVLQGELSGEDVVDFERGQSLLKRLRTTALNK